MTDLRHARDAWRTWNRANDSSEDSGAVQSTSAADLWGEGLLSIGPCSRRHYRKNTIAILRRIRVKTHKTRAQPAPREALGFIRMLLALHTSVRLNQSPAARINVASMAWRSARIGMRLSRAFSRASDVGGLEDSSSQGRLRSPTKATPRPRPPALRIAAAVTRTRGCGLVHDGARH